MATKKKRALRERHSTHPEKTRSELCVWATAAFKLRRKLARTTLLSALKGTDHEHVLDSSRKASHTARCPQLEVQLLQWIGMCETRKLPIVTGATMRQKAEMIRNEMKQQDAARVSPELDAMVFSQGWLQKFQARHGLKSRRTHGEASSVNTAAVDEGRLLLQDITSGYARYNIFNMDETAYFYCMVHGRTVSKNVISGRKRLKKRMTVAVTSNADGSSKVPLLFIGAARRPRCFGDNTGDQLGLQYESAAKGWMTSTIFARWLERFNSAMQEEGRHILLLLDNAASHRVSESLSNISIQMLPSNTTSFLQPQDAGVIRSFKSKIDKLKNKHIVERFDALLASNAKAEKEKEESEIDALFQVDVLKAMRWAQEAWESVTSTTATNCWRHTQILDDDVYELVAELGCR